MIDMKKFLKQTQITQCDNIKGRGLHLPTAPVRTKDEFLKAALRSPMSYIADWIYKFRKSPNLSSMAGSAQHIIHQVHSSTILQQISSIVVQIYTIYSLYSGVQIVLQLAVMASQGTGSLGCLLALGQLQTNPGWV